MGAEGNNVVMDETFTPYLLLFCSAQAPFLFFRSRPGGTLEVSPTSKQTRKDEKRRPVPR